MPIQDLPIEALWKVFIAVDSPFQVYKVFPLVSRKFREAVMMKSPVVQAQVEILCDESETNGTLLQPLESAKLLPTFRKMFVPIHSIFGESPASQQNSPSKSFTLTTASGLSVMDEGSGSSSIISKSVSNDLFNGVSSVEHQQLQYVGLERKIQISVGAIPDAPETLVHYLKELLGKGNIQKQSNSAPHSSPASGRLKVSTTIV